MKLLSQLVVIITLVLCATVAHAEVSGAVAADLTALPDVSGHGIVIIEGQVPLGEHASLRTTLNTDTLTVAIEQLQLGSDTTLMTGVAGEAFIAGLLTDYYLEGELRPEYGFRASWVNAFAELKRRLRRDHYLHWRTSVRQWFFGRTEATSPNVLLPDPFLAVEQTVGWSYWGFRPDPSHSDRFRFFRRFTGFGLGFNFDFHWRSNAARWVIRAVSRNDPERVIGIVSQWAAWGRTLGPRARVQIEQEARYGVGEDDLTRRRVGGFNPYAVNLAGAAWPAFLSSRVLAVHPSIRWELGDIETGVIANVVSLSDPQRRGEDSEMGLLFGAGLLLDYRSGPWQGDVRIGAHPPSRWTRDKAGAGAFVALGRRF